MKNHPELRKGEIFLGNCNNADRCEWQTKRLGETAYDLNGKISQHNEILKPLFAQRQELIDAGFDEREVDNIGLHGFYTTTYWRKPGK